MRGNCELSRIPNVWLPPEGLTTSSPDGKNLHQAFINLSKLKVVSACEYTEHEGSRAKTNSCSLPCLLPHRPSSEAFFPFDSVFPWRFPGSFWCASVNLVRSDRLYLASSCLSRKIGSLCEKRVFFFPFFCFFFVRVPLCEKRLIDWLPVRMEKESKEQRAPPERDFPLQWGSCKRLRCVKVREGGSPARSDGRRRATSRINRRIVAGADKDFPTPRFRHPAQLLYRRFESVGSENQKSRSVTSSPEKEDRCYATRGSLMPHGCEGENGAGGGGVADERGGAVALPRFFISLSNKEKEEDFMAMKGCKLPQRPKKRSKYIQKCILLVSPGTWLPDLSQERYEVREKKGLRKVHILFFQMLIHSSPSELAFVLEMPPLSESSYPLQRKRGLKAMSLESDSE
ncbi:hypothetical protein ZIOFF_017050 [Zingiber officinale]|uniref:Uncharacterized protein n=1 Tax=Zingiber officinale TaxID=94328 RepID=A0A8J5LI20_ZINOF|nr:hypothetical protein ZIOFF_017050 [Zingiber officinale]